jgi:hypothetical protein
MADKPSLNPPVSKGMPEVPPSNPVLFIDAGLVAPHRIIRSRVRGGIVDNR